jgi:hypothetical protein
VCNQPPGECYRDTGACDEQTGECVYEQLPAGEQCGTPTSLCRPRTCTAAGACEENPVECHAECQICNESTGTCLNFNENGVCGDGLKRCSSGQCVSPCGDSCVDYCYENLGLDGTRTNTFFCCPEEARGPNGVCCWVNGGPGTISDDGFCVSPRQVCADGLKCDAECCGSSSTGRAGTCPSIGEFCVGNGTAIARGETCTSDADCTYEANGATIVYGVCTDLDFTIIPEVGPQPVPNSGTCCASGYYAIEGAGSFGLDYFCCEGHKRITFGSNGPECCSFPAYASGGCIGCTCSFNRITRCCA